MIQSVRIGEAMKRRGMVEEHVLDTKYYQENKKDIERYTMDDGKTLYDMPQLEIIGDVLTSNYNNAKSLFNNYLATSMQNEWLKNGKAYTEPKEFINEATKKHIEYGELARTLRDEYKRKIEIEPNATQKFAMSTFADTLRTITDVRQLPILAGVNVLSPIVAGYIGATSTVGTLATSAALNGFENLIEDNVDTYLTEDRFQTFEENFLSVGSGVGVSLFFQGLGKGISSVGNKIDKTITKGNNTKLAVEIMLEAQKKVTNESMATKGDTTVTDYNRFKQIKNNLKAINEYKGTQGSEDNLDKFLKINGATQEEIEKKTELVVTRLVEDETVTEFRSGQDIVDFISDEKNAKKFIQKMKDYKKSNVFTKEELEAFDYFIDLASSEKMTFMQYDADGAIKAVVDDLTKVENGYKPTYTDSSGGKPKNYVEDIDGRPADFDTEQVQNYKKEIFEALGLDEKYDVNTTNISDVIVDLEREVGKRVRKKYNLNSIEEVIEFYKKKYNLDFEYGGTKKISHLGETVAEKTADGKVTKVKIYLGEDIEDLDVQIGVLRHVL